MSKRTGKVEYTKRKDGTHGFRIKAGNGEIVASGEGYTRKHGAKRGFKAVVDAVTQAYLKEITK